MSFQYWQMLFVWLVHYLELSGRKWNLNVCIMELYNAKNNRETQKHWKDFWKFPSHSEVSREIWIGGQFSACPPEDGPTTAVKIKFLHTTCFLYVFLNNRWQKKFWNWVILNRHELNVMLPQMYALCKLLKNSHTSTKINYLISWAEFCCNETHFIHMTLFPDRFQ